MQVKIFTFPYRPELEGFDTGPLDRFCLDKEVFEMQGHFFLREQQPCWTVWVRYRVVAEPTGSTRDDTDKTAWSEWDRLLIRQLKAWRKEHADKVGVPYFVLFNNKELESVVREKVTTKAQLATIRGFGPKKIAQSGDGIIALVKAFLKEKPYKHEPQS